MKVNTAENQTGVRPFADIDIELREAKSQLEEARESVSRSNRNEAIARDLVNKLQKQFDAAVLVYRRDAPDGTGWAEEQRKARLEA